MSILVETFSLFQKKKTLNLNDRIITILTLNICVINEIRGTCFNLNLIFFYFKLESRVSSGQHRISFEIPVMSSWQQHQWIQLKESNWSGYDDTRFIWSIFLTKNQLETNYFDENEKNSLFTVLCVQYIGTKVSKFSDNIISDLFKVNKIYCYYDSETRAIHWFEIIFEGVNLIMTRENCKIDFFFS